MYLTVNFTYLDLRHAEESASVAWDGNCAFLSDFQSEENAACILWSWWNADFTFDDNALMPKRVGVSEMSFTLRTAENQMLTWFKYKSSLENTDKMHYISKYLDLVLESPQQFFLV